jgi:4-diphosphocytidyl-2-C-methyl-D-erythritol kinase
MTGTGPTVFGLFDRADFAQAAYERLNENFRDTFLTQTV